MNTSATGQKTAVINASGWFPKSYDVTKRSITRPKMEISCCHATLAHTCAPQKMVPCGDEKRHRGPRHEPTVVAMNMSSTLEPILVPFDCVGCAVAPVVDGNIGG